MAKEKWSKETHKSEFTDQVDAIGERINEIKR